MEFFFLRRVGSTWGIRTAECVVWAVWRLGVETQELALVQCAPRSRWLTLCSGWCIRETEMGAVASQPPSVQIRYFRADGPVQESPYSKEVV